MFGISLTPAQECPGQRLYARRLFLLFETVAGMSRDLGRDVPDLRDLSLHSWGTWKIFIKKTLG